MDSSQVSNFESLLARDTLGPVRLNIKNEWKVKHESLVEPSSSHSSVTELGHAEDKGLRSSFREQPYVHMDEEETDNEATNKVKVKKVPVYTISSDRASLTPDSVVYGGTRSLLTNFNGGLRNINASGVQENYDSRKLGKSMRAVLRQDESEKDKYPKITELEPEPFNRKMDIKEKKVMVAPKVVAFCLVVMIFVAGLVLLIYFKKEDKPEGQRGKILPDEPADKEDEKEKSFCPEVEVNLRGVIHFNCSLRDVKLANVHHIFVTPPPYFNKGTPFVIGVHPKEKKLKWSAYLDNYDILQVSGPEATCSSGGTFQLNFRNNRNKTEVNTNVRISVKSEVLRVNVSLTQDTVSNETDFTIGCSTNSGCEQSFVEFFAEMNKEEQHLRNVNFSCTITYNDYDGYSISCVGNIPDYLMSEFERITCRPRSSLLDDLDKDDLEDLEVEIELPECDLTKHCGYQCKDERDYYVVSQERCDIFHRCYKRRVFTSYCAPGTFFDPHESFCACRHTSDLPWCQTNGALKPGSDVTERLCIEN
ncbi:uncharacterized protein LOC123553936 isoform X2 [Mercenaria mercenaria]|uniref:uncharacterized protein LOC123553936 isoform X2 n=1 Tax=Mercenaria mercenaria TaxID=6596 RepID=UPI00234EB65A|nr:uncharacterized protein LOC123553936 isoform X2 [Mercenaria mercenaria]